jgi:hypothetical protein
LISKAFPDIPAWGSLTGSVHPRKKRRRIAVITNLVLSLRVFFIFESLLDRLRYP